MKEQKTKLERTEYLLNRVCLVLWAIIMIGAYFNWFSLSVIFSLEAITGLLVFADISVINKIAAKRQEKRNKSKVN